jgi:hypothetical protein
VHLFVIPDKPGKIRITGVKFCVFNLISHHKIDPIEITVMPEIPELKFELERPSRPVELLDGQLFEFGSLVKNLTSVAVTEFIATSDVHGMEFNPDDISRLNALQGDMNHYLHMRYHAKQDNKMPLVSLKSKAAASSRAETRKVGLYFTYKGEFSRNRLRETIELPIDIKPCLKMTAAQLVPFYKFPHQAELKWRNPAMNTVCGKFSLAGEDIGLNDSNHCVLMLTFYNEAIYTLNITCSISEDTGRDRTRLTLQGGQSARASLTVTRRSDISVTSLLNSVRVTWTSGDKKGICDLALDGLHLSLASPSPVTFAYRVSSGEHLDCLSVTVTLSKPEPNSFLYIYPYSEASDSFKLLPKSLVLAGTLSVSLPDVQGDFTYSLHYKKLTDDAYWVVAAIGSRKSVTVWAHQAWAL